MEVRFTPLDDFIDADLKSAYCVGLNYTVRDGNDLLSAKVQEWLSEGKVRLATESENPAGKAVVGGAGVVK